MFPERQGNELKRSGVGGRGWWEVEEEEKAPMDRGKKGREDEERPGIGEG